MFDIDVIQTLEDYQRSNFYRAKVISLDDPLNLNRVQILIYGLTDDIPDTSQPWAELQFTAGFSTYPVVDDVIWLFFENWDMFRPVYLGTIYAGTDVDNDKGYEKFASQLSAVKESGSRSDYSLGYDFSAYADIPSYRSALRNVNSIPVDKHLVLKDTTSHFDSLTTESALWKTASGQKVYPWYQLQGSQNSDWTRISGGWKFLSATELKRGLAYFPDNIHRTYLKRYKNWVRWTVSKAPAGWSPDGGVFKNDGGISSSYVPSSPEIYYDADMYRKDLLTPTDKKNYILTPSFPFGKMKISSRKHYKQSSWLSYDGKSAIELDDNDNYERLLINFNFGDGGLEFSQAGFHGLDMWTSGAFKLRSWGRGSTGNGGEEALASEIAAYNSDLYISSDKNIGITAKKGINISSDGPVLIRSNSPNTLNVVSKKGINILSTSGHEALSGIMSQGNQHIATGFPLVSGPGGQGMTGASFQGWMPFLNQPEAMAKKYFKSMNMALRGIKELCDQVGKAGLPTDPVGAIVKAWGLKLASQLNGLMGNAMSSVHLAGASNNFNMELQGRKAF